MRKVSLVAVALLLTACANLGGLGDLGGILGSPSPEKSSDVRGTITGIDTQARRIDLNVGYINQLRQSGGQTGSIYYDDRTRVEYQGGTYNPADLERGDEISVTGANNNGRYVASVITVTRNVRS